MLRLSSRNSRTNRDVMIRLSVFLLRCVPLRCEPCSVQGVEGLDKSEAAAHLPADSVGARVLEAEALKENGR